VVVAGAVVVVSAAGFGKQNGVSERKRERERERGRERER